MKAQCIILASTLIALVGSITEVKAVQIPSFPTTLPPNSVLITLEFSGVTTGFGGGSAFDNSGISAGTPFSAALVYPAALAGNPPVISEARWIIEIGDLAIFSGGGHLWEWNQIPYGVETPALPQVATDYHSLQNISGVTFRQQPIETTRGLSDFQLREGGAITFDALDWTGGSSLGWSGTITGLTVSGIPVPETGSTALLLLAGILPLLRKSKTHVG